MKGDTKSLVIIWTVGIVLAVIILNGVGSYIFKTKLTEKEEQILELKSQINEADEKIHELEWRLFEKESRVKEIESEPKEEIKPKFKLTFVDSVSELLAKLGWNEKEALEVADKVRNSTVCILPAANASCGATAWIAGKGLVVTCGHCVHGHEGENETTYFWIKTIDGKIFPVERLEILEDTDLGIANVTANASELPPPLQVGFASVGDPVLAIGNPSGVGTWVVVLGEILSVNSWGEGGYISDLPSKPGMSGSPVVNKKGEVIGVVSHSGSTMTYDPYPLAIVTSLEQISNIETAIESGTKMIEMIKHHQ